MTDPAILIRQLQGALGGKRLMVGAATVSTTATVDGNATVGHTLGSAPVAVIATGSDALGRIAVTADSFTATTFRIGLRYTDGIARTQANTVYWVAFA